MAMRRLADPVLNDLLLMVSGRRNTELTGAAISRYVAHLDRIDRELAEARTESGAPPLAFGDDTVTVSLKQLHALEGHLADVSAQLRAATALVSAKTTAAADVEAFAATLLSEFADVIPNDVKTAHDAALALLRAWREDRLEPAQAVAHEVQTSALTDLASVPKPSPIKQERKR